MWLEEITSKKVGISLDLSNRIETDFETRSEEVIIQ
jgi:hypothetical protein